MLDLCFIAGGLLIAVSTDAAVRCDSELWLLSLFDVVPDLPQHKTDAIFRVFNGDRYDDRDVVITNLIESYDRLMALERNT